MLRLMEASARLVEVGLLAMVAIVVLQFAHDAYRFQGSQPVRQVLLARLKELRRRHNAVHDFRLVAATLDA